MVLKAVVLKLPNGQPPPMDYTFVRTVRGYDVYHKMVDKPTAKEINDELSDLLSKFTMSQTPVPVEVSVADNEQQLEQLFGQLTMGGGRRSRRMKRRGKSRKHHK